MQEKEKRYDVDGDGVLSETILELINSYPGLSGEVMFSTLEDESGTAMFPVTGAVIETETEDITGHVKQTCLYPFYLVYRASGLSGDRKIAVKEYLDDLGRWLEGQEVETGGTLHKLEEYPKLSGNRRFTEIKRQTPAHLDSAEENNTENWAVYITAKYTNEYDK